MRLAVPALLLSMCACTSGPYSLESQLSRRLGNIRDHLAPESLPGTLDSRVEGMVRSASRLLQPGHRLQNLDARVRGAVAAEWNRAGRLPEALGRLAGTAADRFDRTVRKIEDPPPAWVNRISPLRILERFADAIMNLGTVLGLDRRMLPMPGDPERHTDPTTAPGPTSNLWERILFRLRL